MKVFLSWSGDRSQKVAVLLNDWLSCVLQTCRPWVSSRDLDRGTLWFGEINDQLKETSVGIICLTQENKNRPWILFEAGALAKGLTTSRVCTLLVDLEPKDIEDPLAQFNHTLPTKDGIKSLVRTLNNCLGNQALELKILEKVFDTNWSEFEKSFKEILNTTKEQPKAAPKPKEEVLEEILENTRGVNLRLRRLENELEANRMNSLYESFEEHPHIKDMINFGAPYQIVMQEAKNLPEATREQIKRYYKKFSPNTVLAKKGGDVFS